MHTASLVGVRAIIALTNSLELTTLAEGVETEEQRNILIALGCDRLQGFLAGRPVPAAQARSFLNPGKANVIQAPSWATPLNDS